MYTKKIGLYVLCFSLPFMFSSCNKIENKNEKKSFEISIATNVEILKSSSTFLKQFSSNHPEYTININIYEKDYLENLIKHNSLKEDIYLIDDLLTINLSKDNFADFTLSEAFGNYSGYIKNYIKAEDNNIYCLPSVGSTYSYCLNVDLFKKCNLTIPSTINELIDFATNSKNYAIPFGSSFKDENYYLDAMFQMTIPGFFSSVKGSNFFNEFLSGKNTFSSSDLTPTLTPYLNNIYLLTTDGFYDDTLTSEQSKENFIQEKQFILSISPKFNFEEYYQDNNCTFNYVYYPLLGSKKNNGWICANSDFYLAVNKNNYSVNNVEIDEFVKYYASLDGQNKLLIDEFGNKKSNCFSYLSTFETDSGDKNKYIKQTISQSHVYLIDQIAPTFKSSTNYISQYANDKISMSKLYDDFDYNNEIQINYSNNKFTLDELKQYSSTTKEDLVNTLKIISYSIKNQLSLDAIVIDESFLKYPILNGSIYESELTSIFERNLLMQYVNVKGSELKKIIDYTKTANENYFNVKEKEYDTNKFFSNYNNVLIKNVDFSFLSEEQYLLSGAYFDSTGYYMGNKKEIEDDKTYYLALPSEITSKNQFELVLGNTFNLLDVYVQYLRSTR